MASVINDRAEYLVPRHEDFDEYWDLHQNLVFWWARRLAQIFNRSMERPAYTQGDFLGHLTIRFNYVVSKYKPELSSFSTLFSMHIIGSTINFVLSKDSEVWALKYWQRASSKEDKATAEQIKEFHESEYFLYRIPEDSSWAEEIIDLFPDTTKLWDFLTFNLHERHKNVILWRWRDDKTLQEIGELMNITKERVRQIEERSLFSIQRRIYTLERFRALFAKSPLEG